LNNITTGRTGSNPLFFQWSFASQPGVPWQALTSAGTNQGSDTSYQYTDWQAYDIAPGNAFIHVGDVIELIVVASGCSPGGHDGHLYLDEVHTLISPRLWVVASGPNSSTPGSNITYTYSYSNATAAVANNVQIVAALPVQGKPSGSPLSTTFVSVTTPTTGTSPSCSGTNPVTCNVGTLQPGDKGTFQLTVNIPSAWAISTGPVNNGNYPISATGLNTLLGPLVQTALLAPSSLSNLVASTSGLATAATLGVPYSGTFTCSNVATASATGDATNAACDITNLPPGLSVSGCSISPSNTSWTEPSTIPSGQTVTCNVTGTPTTVGSSTATLTANASNNSNSTSNVAVTTIATQKPAPTVRTTAGGTVTVGSGTYLTDSAVLSGGSNPSGTITFTLRDSHNVVVYTDVVTVNGNGNYSTSAGNNPGGYLPSATGTYLWNAVYSGDSNNNGASDNGQNESETVTKPVAHLGTANGSGTIFTHNNQASFSFSVSDNNKKGTPSGSLTYTDIKGGIKLTSNLITGVTLITNQATITGGGTIANSNPKRKPIPVSFTAVATDNGTPRAPKDVFTIQISSPYSAAGNLTSGNITVN
jgi:hypothetical protein